MQTRECVYVCEREREKERGWERERSEQRKWLLSDCNHRENKWSRYHMSKVCGEIIHYVAKARCNEL